MTDTPSKPKRRRWLIVASAILLVSAVSWWYWPRGDVRFVGKWRTPKAGRLQQITTFHAYGVVEVGSYHYRWWVEGDKIYRRRLYGKGGFRGIIADVFQEIRERLTGEWHRQAYAGSRFVESGPDEVTINNWASAEPQVWSRIPE